MKHNPHLIFSIALVALAAVACSSKVPDPSGGSTGQGTGASTATGGGTGGHNGALSIVALSSTVPTITGGHPGATETDTVTFVAIVTDIAGLDTIAGGKLIDDMNHTYGAFGAGANKGTYNLSLTWSQINQVSPIDTTVGPKRTFTAQFFDNQNNTATASVDIALACREFLGLVGACAGVCADIKADGSNCGACGHPCSKGMICGNSTCVNPHFGSIPGNTDTYTDCLAVYTVPSGTTCVDICNEVGLNCTAFLLFNGATCDPQNPDSAPGCNVDIPSVPGRFQCACG